MKRKKRIRLPKFGGGKPGNAQIDPPLTLPGTPIVDFDVQGNEELPGLVFDLLEELRRRQQQATRPQKQFATKEPQVQQPLPLKVINGTNVIPEQFGDIRFPLLQKKVDLAKLDMYDFLVNDYYDRAKEFHPELTKQLVVDAYNQVPILVGANNNFNGVTQGQYTARALDGHRDYNEGYIKIAPSVEWSPYKAPNKSGVVIGSLANKKIPYDQIISHEVGHMYDDYLYGGTKNINDQEKALLEEAYGELFPGISPEELKQINRESKYKIHKANNGVIGDSLTNAIKNTSDNDEMWIFDAEPIGYGNRTHMQNVFNKWKKEGVLKAKMNKIREAQIRIAQQQSNPYQRMYNPVYLYTPNMNLNYEMA